MTRTAFQGRLLKDAVIELTAPALGLDVVANAEFQDTLQHPYLENNQTNIGKILLADQSALSSFDISDPRDLSFLNGDSRYWNFPLEASACKQFQSSTEQNKCLDLKALSESPHHPTELFLSYIKNTKYFSNLQSQNPPGNLGTDFNTVLFFNDYRSSSLSSHTDFLDFVQLSQVP